MFTVLMLVGLTLLQPAINDTIKINRLALHALAVPTNQSSVTTALEGSKSAITASPREKALWATIWLTQGRANEAIAYFKTLLATPGRTGAWKTQLVRAYRTVGRVEDARQVASQIPDAREAISVHCRSRLMYYIDAGEAKFWCPMLEPLEAHTADEECLLGQYYASSGQPEAAEQTFARAADMPGITAGCLHQFGQFRLKQHDYVAARSLFVRAYDLEPSAQHLRAIGASYETAGEPESALAYYRQAHLFNPRGSECAGSLGAIGGVYYHYYREYAEAARDFRAAIRCDPRVDVSIYWLLANSERRLGHMDAAVEAYRVVEERLAGSVYLIEWRHEYAAYLIDLGRPSEAQQVYLSILQDAPDDSVAQNALRQ